VLLLCVCGFEKLRQGVELVFPESPIVFDPTGGFFHGLGRQPTAMDAAIDFAAQQAGGFQHAQVLGDRRKGHIEWLGEFAYGGFALRQAGEDGATGVVRESAEDVIEGGVRRSRIVNHMV
jgi:hypothetical protein